MIFSTDRLSTEGPTVNPSGTPPGRLFPFKDFAVRYALQIFTVLALIVIAILVPNFRQFSNLQDVALQSSFAGFSAAGMTLLIIGGMIDLSVAGIIALTAVTLANLLPHVPLGLATALSLGVGAVL